MMTTKSFPLNDPKSYIRVQTGYYKKCLRPNLQGDFSEGWIPWSSEMLKQDITRAMIKKIRRFDGM